MHAALHPCLHLLLVHLLLHVFPRFPVRRCCAPLAFLQESLALQAKQRQLAAALKSAQQEARAMAGQLDALRTMSPALEEAQAAAAASEAALELAQGRSALLERSWTTAAQDARAQAVRVGLARGKRRGRGIWVCRDRRASDLCAVTALMPA